MKNTEATEQKELATRPVYNQDFEVSRPEAGMIIQRALDRLRNENNTDAMAFSDHADYAAHHEFSAGA